MKNTTKSIHLSAVLMFLAAALSVTSCGIAVMFLTGVCCASIVYAFGLMPRRPSVLEIIQEAQRERVKEMRFARAINVTPKREVSK
jgi:hypothetical protein